jgi:hypothetical protein
LKKLHVEHKDMTQAQLEEKISEYLFTYRNTPSTVTGKTPSQLFLNCEPKTVLTNLRPPEQTLVTQGTKPKKEFISNEDVFVQTHSNKIINWIPGTIVKQLSPYVYRVLVNDVYRNCHINQLRRMSADCSGPFELNVSRTPEKVVLGTPRAALGSTGVVLADPRPVRLDQPATEEVEPVQERHSTTPTSPANEFLMNNHCSRHPAILGPAPFLCGVQKDQNLSPNVYMNMSHKHSYYCNFFS